jgi:hypothetical protein
VNIEWHEPLEWTASVKEWSNLKLRDLESLNESWFFRDMNNKGELLMFMMYDSWMLDGYKHAMDAYEFKNRVTIGEYAFLAARTLGGETSRVHIPQSSMSSDDFFDIEELDIEPNSALAWQVHFDRYGHLYENKNRVLTVKRAIEFGVSYDKLHRYLKTFDNKNRHYVEFGLIDNELDNTLLDSLSDGANA